MELRIKTEVGDLTGVFEATAVNCYTDVYTAWFKEMPSVVVQADSVGEAIDELHVCLEVILEYKRSELAHIEKISKDLLSL